MAKKYIFDRTVRHKDKKGNKKTFVPGEAYSLSKDVLADVGELAIEVVEDKPAPKSKSTKAKAEAATESAADGDEAGDDSAEVATINTGLTEDPDDKDQVNV